MRKFLGAERAVRAARVHHSLEAGCEPKTFSRLWMVARECLLRLGSARQFGRLVWCSRTHRHCASASSFAPVPFQGRPPSSFAVEDEDLALAPDLAGDDEGGLGTAVLQGDCRIEADRHLKLGERRPVRAPSWPV
jgi:hypothetical protein